MKKSKLTDSFSFQPEIRSALQDNRPVLALESTIIAHGMPSPENIEFAKTAEAMVRKSGVEPATIAIVLEWILSA